MDNTLPKAALKAAIPELPPLALRKMFDVLSEMVCICVDSKIVYINRVGVDILGADHPDELLGNDFRDFFGKEFLESIGGFFKVLADETEPIPLMMTNLKGRKLSMGITIQRMPEVSADAYGVSATNITKHIKLSHDMRDSQSRFSKVVNQAMNFTCILDEGIITYINQAGLTLLKVDNQSQAVGQNINTFLHPDYHDLLCESIHEFIGHDELTPLRFVDIHHDPIDVEVAVFAIQDQNRPRHMFEASDITAHNQAVMALRHSIEHLEQRVEERTAALQSEVVERKRIEEILRHTASHDNLTGLPNRAMLITCIEIALKQSRRNKKPCAILFIDLDGFKAINDTLGHDVGDLLLQQVAARLKESIRETDTAARIGGDEFVVVLSTIETHANTSPVAQLILDNISKLYMIQGNEIKIGASMGISFYPDHGLTGDALLKQADKAMYHVKGNGKNAFAIAENDL